MKKTNNLKRFYGEDAVVDNSVLMDFFELNRLDILFKVFSSITIADIVFEKEVLKEVKLALEKYEFFRGQIESREGFQIYIVLSENKKYEQLSIPDKITVSIAGQNLCYCTSNDRLLRTACIDLGVNLTGTLGILGCAIELEIITQEEFNCLIEKLLSDKTSCFIAPKIVNEFVEEHEYGK